MLRQSRITGQVFCPAWKSFRACLTVLILSLIVITGNAKHLRAETTYGNTHLVSVRSDFELSGIVRKVRLGGFELSDGTPVSFEDWYSSVWVDTHATWMTEVTKNFGILWGFGTGERGEKYHIQPSFKIGFISQLDLNRNSVLSLSVTAILGGRLKEDTCTADFGDIGGIQTVNCRLAATPLPPEETLEYLFDEPPSGQVSVILRYQFRF